MWITLVILCLAVSVVSAREPLTRIKPATLELKDLVQRGRERSPAFRDLVARLETQEWLVFIQPGRCADRLMVGCLVHTVGAFEGRLYLRLLVAYEGRHPDVVIATIAHELQHAFEVASDGTVTDNASLAALAKRIANDGFRTAKATIYETNAARRMGDVVLTELQRCDRERTQ